MRKRIVTAITAFAVALQCLLVLCACDLSHKHYYNDVGMCGICENSVAIALTYDADTKEYRAPTRYIPDESVSVDGCYFYYFDAHGEEYVDFRLSSEGGARIKRVDIYLSSVSHKGPATFTDEGIFIFKMVGAKKYYLKVEYEGAGTVDFRVTDATNYQNK